MPDINQQFIPEDPRKLIRLNKFEKIPLMIGITNNEGAFIKNQWIDLSKQGYKNLKRFMESNIIANIIEMMQLNQFSQKQVREIINWRFFDQIPKTNAHLLNALQRIISETRYELPFFETIEILSSEGRNDELGMKGNESDDGLINVSSVTPQLKKRKTNEENVYVYSFQQSNSIDMRGKINYFGGASHSSDLPILMGPSLFQQISRRRLTQQEEKFCKKMRQMLCDFVKSG